MRFLLLLALALSACTPTLATEDKKLFFMFFVKSDGKRPDDKEVLAKMQRAHIDNLDRQFKLKNLIAAGPLNDPTTVRRGVAVLTVTDAQKIPGLFQEDPFVQHRLMKVVAREWDADPKGINLELPEPTKIEENRIAIVTAFLDSPIDEQALEEHRRYIARQVKPSVGGRTKSDRYEEILLFQGKAEEKEILTALEADPLVRAGLLQVEFMPLWMAKGALFPRRS